MGPWGLPAHEKENLRFIKEQFSTVISLRPDLPKVRYTSRSEIWHTVKPARAGRSLCGLHSRLPLNALKSDSPRAPLICSPALRPPKLLIGRRQSNDE